MNKKLTQVAITLVLTIVFSIVYAETNAETDKDDQQSDSQTDEKKVMKPKKNMLKEFTPSEEISIDKPVAFPADI